MSTGKSSGKREEINPGTAGFRYERLWILKEAISIGRQMAYFRNLRN